MVTFAGNVGVGPVGVNEADFDKLMRIALSEGRKALPGCLPNPPVGCLLVRGDQIIARGWTQVPGQEHAEAMALRQTSGDLVEMVAVVTLEPCSFSGRTPSCAKALIARRVGKVIVGLIDPHPRNQGRGLEMLRDAGIPVVSDVLREEVARELSPYLWGGRATDK